VIGERITPEEVKRFVVEVRGPEESVAAFGVFLLAQLDADIDANADFLKAIDVVDKFGDEPGIWRSLVDSLKNIKVDPSKTEALSVEFTAVILENDTKHKLPAVNKARTLKDLARVFTSSNNLQRLLDSNKASSAEL
jgi:hypothetical protein